MWDYSAETRRERSIVERVGSIVINLLLVGFIIGGSVLIARAINWGEISGFVKELAGANETSPVQPQQAIRRQSKPKAGSKADTGDQVDDPGSVIISSETQAAIYVDGRKSGVTPRKILLPPGNHEIKLVADGFETWASGIRVKSQQEIEIKADLKKRSAP